MKKVQAMGNKQLARAKETRNDEFYTQLTDIEKELRHYKQYFKGATIFCNCDDPEYSNFWIYFQLNFYEFGLKKLISTHYEKEKPSYKMEIVATDTDRQIGIPDYVKTPLKQNGDFRSEECIEILKEADIVITNPPFSLFREYIAQLIEYNKKFIIIGNQNALHYKEVFPLFQQNKVWLGATNFTGGAAFFIGSKDLYDPKKMSNPKHAYIKDDKLYWRVNGVRWLTNLDIEKRHEVLPLYRTYNKEDYPTYANFDAIEVDKVSEIPMDYYGYIGVPDNFLQKHNPEQFEIIGLGSGYLGQSIGITGIPKEHKAMMKGHSAAGDLYYLENGVPKVPYSRIIIRRKKREENED